MKEKDPNMSHRLPYGTVLISQSKMKERMVCTRFRLAVGIVLSLLMASLLISVVPTVVAADSNSSYHWYCPNCGHKLALSEGEKNTIDRFGAAGVSATCPICGGSMRLATGGAVSPPVTTPPTNPSGKVEVPPLLISAIILLTVLLIIIAGETFMKTPKERPFNDPMVRRRGLLPVLKISLSIALVFNIAALLYSLLGLSGQMILALLLVGLAVLAAYMVLGTYLAIHRYHGRVLRDGENPRIQRMVEGLARQFQIPTPKIVIIEDADPNAFAIGLGPKHALIGLNTGLIQCMDPEQLAAVMAHEMAHINNYDTFGSTISIALLNTIRLVALIASSVIFLVLVLLMIMGSNKKSSNVDVGGAFAICYTVYLIPPLLALVGSMFMSRRVEFRADRTSALITGKPLSLASALQVMRRQSSRNGARPRKMDAYSGIMINNNASNSFRNRLFSTHPPLEERERRLVVLAAEMNKRN